MAYKCSHCGYIMYEERGKCPNCGVYLINVPASQPTTQSSAQVDARCKGCQSPVKIDDFVCQACGLLLLSHIIFWITLVSIFLIAWSTFLIIMIVSSLGSFTTANVSPLIVFMVPWFGLMLWLRFYFVKLNKARRVHDSLVPIRGLRVTVEKYKRERFSEQLKKFADAQAYHFDLRNRGTDNELYFHEILGDNIKILTSISGSDPNIVSIRVYGKSPEVLLPKKKIVDDLVNDLKSFISQIPNLTITEEKSM